MLTHLSLFSGIGGADLAAQWAGFETVAFVERDKFCQQVLKKHWPEVPIYDDVKEFSGESFRGVTVLSGGFPCQPFSSAGKRKGKEDSRYLFPEMLRIISEARPAWVIGENVAGLLSLPELENILLSLEAKDYELWPLVLPACSVGAPHIRNRIFILAHSRSSDDFGRSITEHNGIRERELHPNESGNRNEVRSATSSCDSGVLGNATDREGGEAFPSKPRGLHAEFSGENRIGDASNVNGDGHRRGEDFRGFSKNERGISEAQRTGQGRWGDIGGVDWNSDWLTVASELCRVDDGLPAELDKGKRLKALGNAIVPQQIYPIFQAIADIEKW